MQVIAARRSELAKEEEEERARKTSSAPIADAGLTSDQAQGSPKRPLSFLDIMLGAREREGSWEDSGASGNAPEAPLTDASLREEVNTFMIAVSVPLSALP